MIEIRNNNMAKKSNSSGFELTTTFTNDQRLLPVNDFIETINQSEVYNQERLNCNKIRLVVTLNPMCSNVLFNRITEVVKDEGTDNCVCLNYAGIPNYPLTSVDAITTIDKDFSTKLEKVCGNRPKPLEFFGREGLALGHGSVELTRDTQLTAEGLGIEYKCGMDIFNNHLLRSKTFKCICDTKQAKDRYFNTLYDYMRESNGELVYDYVDDDEVKQPLHLYLKDEIMDYDVAVDTNLDEDNGWLGFINKGKILTYTSDVGDGNTALPINRVINNQPACSFIDLCPDRTLWYFTPKYNKERNRFEKNWNYCLTYPYSSTTNVSFIRQETNSLKVFYYDDSVTVGGMAACKIVSFCKHGLQVNDTINLYVNGSERNEDGDRILKYLKVVKVSDEYTFYVSYSQSEWIYDSNFITWNNKLGFENQTSSEFKWDETSKKTVTYINDGIRCDFPVFVDANGSYKSNISPTCNDISFKQVYGRQEAQYYVRIFSKIPNWKFAETIPDKNFNVAEWEEKHDKYVAKEYEFDNTLSKLAFAKNAYGDDISQIVFTDDINIEGLTDNLGRPVSNIYLTIIKNNAGYREWYGKNGISVSTGDGNIEYSHIFGKNSCAFELSPESVMNNEHQNIIQTNNISNSMACNGLDVESILDLKEPRPDKIASDEIEFNSVYGYDGDTKFYGDLCMYSPATLGETVLDDIWYRFNTAQRELTAIDTTYDYLQYLVYDEIESDDLDGKFNAHITSSPIENACASQEGYKYKPHYKIPIKSISRDVFTAKPHIVDLLNVDYSETEDFPNGLFTITTVDESYNEKYDKFVIYNAYRDEYYEGRVVNVISSLAFECELSAEKGVVEMFDDLEYYKLIRKQETIPDDAVLMRDGSLLYGWREIYQNGFDNYSVNETYPFTNGALYVEKDLRVFVKRQDPDRILKTASVVNSATVNDVEPNKPTTFTSDEFYDDISCFGVTNSAVLDAAGVMVGTTTNDLQNIANNMSNLI